MDFRVLGPLEVYDGDRLLGLGGTRQRALLALLVLHANEVVSSDRLIAELWGEERLEDASKALQVAVSRLRRTLEPGRSSRQASGLLVTRAPGYELVLDRGQLDLDRFEDEAAIARKALAAGDPARAADTLSDALALWRGPPLADLAYESFAQTEIARLQELRTSALEDRIAADLELGRHSKLIAELHELVERHPLRERLREQLMLALYRSGRQADALEVYQDARRALTDELGIEPSRELRDLQQQILTQDPLLDRRPVGEATPDASRGVFVGRERELGELVGALDDVLAGRGRLVLLAGEPGIGKSRLADELMAQARSRGARVIVGRCWEAGGAPAYWPWVQSLRAYVRESDAGALRSQLGTGAADLGQILPELRQRFRDLPEAPSLESEGARFRLFDAVSSFLRSATQVGPLVLALDDLHAADEPSLLLLRFVAREMADSRLLVVCLFRDIDPALREPLTSALAELVRESHTAQIGLAGLSEPEIAHYIDLATEIKPAHELVEAIHAETEGNPLFVAEVVRLLDAEGGLAAADAHLRIPSGIRAAIGQRVRRLSQGCQSLLVPASVLGREFELDALARLSELPHDQLLDGLDEAIVERVVGDVPGSPGRLRFGHALIRDTLYEGLTTASRVRLHRLAVDALEVVYGDEPGPHLAELAHHSIAGSDFDKGLSYARHAGDHALELLAYEEAARLYQTALKALDLAGWSDETVRCELLLSLGEAESRAGNPPAAKKAFIDAAGIARRLGLRGDLARAAAGYAGPLVWSRAGDDDRLVPLLEEGLAALDEEDVELRARLLARLAGALRDEHARDRRETLSRHAVELARQTGNPAVLAWALHGRAAATLGPDTVAECLSLGRELCALGERSGDRERVVAGHAFQILAQLQVGDVHGAEVDLAAASRIADELRQPAPLWEVGTSRAMLAITAGRLSEADELVAKALTLGERAQPEAAIPVHRLQRYALCDFRCNLEEIEPAIRELVSDYPARPVFRCALAHLHARLGRTGEAKRALDALAPDAFAALPFDQEWLYGMSLLAETAAILGDADSAAALYGLLVPWAAVNVTDWPEGVRGSVSRYLGLLATTTKHWQQAERHFEDALAMNAAMGARPWLAHTHTDYARMLRARDGSGDRERAQQFLDAALSLYRELGMESYAANASALAQKVRVTP